MPRQPQQPPPRQTRTRKKASGLLFGTGGVPKSAKKGGGTVGGIRRIKELGLDAMEMEFVYGVKMGEATARAVAAAAAELGVKLTAHGPYYVNLNAATPEKIAGSQEMVWQTAHVGALAGAHSVVFHAAFRGTGPPELAYATVKNALAAVTERLKREGNDVWVRPELMGKKGAFGTLDEVLRLSAELDGRVLPGIDFAHLHAAEGKVNSYAEFIAVLKAIEERLGRVALDSLHIHLSGIRYGKSGEISHLNLKESDLKYVELLQALHDVDAKGIVICESPNLEDDALLLQETYSRLK
jgi:deoxyribonuclease-4